MSYIISEKGWQLERRVPPMLIFAMLLQIGAGLVWAAQLDVRVARMEKDIDRIVSKLETLTIRAGRL